MQLFSILVGKWSEMNQITNEAQATFRNGYCTTDNIVSLHALIVIHKYIRLYCTFIDFKNAFYNICHKTLFESFSSIGINDRFLACFMKIYKNNNSCVKVGESYTSCFSCLKGTQQGGKCSPQVFNLFINDICSHLNNDKTCGIFVSNNIPNIGSLLYADDVASPNDSDTTSKADKLSSIFLSCFWCEN